MRPRELASKLTDAFIDGQPTGALLEGAPEETVSNALTLARNTSEQVRHHARRYAQAPTSETWAAIPERMRHLVDRYIRSRRAK